MRNFYLLFLALLSLIHYKDLTVNQPSIIHLQYSNIFEKENLYIYNLSLPRREIHPILKPVKFLKLNINISFDDYQDHLLELERENTLHISSREVMIRDLISQERFIFALNYMSKNTNVIPIIKILNNFQNRKYLTLLDTKVVFEIITMDSFYFLTIKRLSIENKKLYYIDVCGRLNKHIIIE